MSRTWRCLLLLVVLSGACAPAPVPEDVTREGEVLVAEQSQGGVTYRLFSRDDCFRLDTTVDGAGSWSETTCAAGSQSLVSPRCVEEAPPDSTEPEADVGFSHPAPSVCLHAVDVVAVYGRVPEEFPFVCIPAYRGVAFVAEAAVVEAGVGGVFMSLADASTADTMAPAAIPLTASGRSSVGDMYDPPPKALEDLCFHAGPWDAPPPPPRPYPLIVALDDALVGGSGTYTLTTDQGYGAAVSFGATATGVMVLDALLDASTSRLRLEVQPSEGQSAIQVGWFELPDEVVRELRSGLVCSDAPVLLVEMSGGVVDGEAAAVRVTALSPEAAAERWPDVGLPVSSGPSRQPGEPCAGRGEQVVAQAPQQAAGGVFVGLLAVEATAAAKANAPADRAFVVRSASEEWSQLIRELPEGGMGFTRAASVALRPGLTIGLRDLPPGSVEEVGDPEVGRVLMDEALLPVPQPPVDMGTLFITLGEAAITPDGGLDPAGITVAYGSG